MRVGNRGSLNRLTVQERKLCASKKSRKKKRTPQKKAVSKVAPNTSNKRELTFNIGEFEVFFVLHKTEDAELQRISREYREAMAKQPKSRLPLLNMFVLTKVSPITKLTTELHGIMNDKTNSEKYRVAAGVLLLAHHPDILNGKFEGNSKLSDAFAVQTIDALEAIAPRDKVVIALKNKIKPHKQEF